MQTQVQVQARISWYVSFTRKLTYAVCLQTVSIYIFISGIKSIEQHTQTLSQKGASQLVTRSTRHSPKSYDELTVSL